MSVELKTRSKRAGVDLPFPWIPNNLQINIRYFVADGFAFPLSTKNLFFNQISIALAVKWLSNHTHYVLDLSKFHASRLALFKIAGDRLYLANKILNLWVWTTNQIAIKTVPHYAQTEYCLGTFPPTLVFAFVFFFCFILFVCLFVCLFRKQNCGQVLSHRYTFWNESKLYYHMHAHDLYFAL